jgi:hypothetical protein
MPRQASQPKARAAAPQKVSFSGKSLVLFLQRLSPEIAGLPQAFFRIKCEGFL